MKMYISTHDKPFFPENILEKFKYIKSIGFDGFEIDGRVLLDNLKEVKHAIEVTGLKVKAACGGYSGWIGDFNELKRQAGLKDISQILAVSHQLGIDGIVVPAAWGMFSKRLPPHTPPRSDDDSHEILLDSLDFLEQVAKRTKTKIFLEPLNRYEDHMLNHTKEAYDLISEGDYKHVGICFDFYHMNIEEAKVNQVILTYGSKITHVHLADNHRFQPGDGHIDFVSGFKALKSVGYDGGFAFECRVLGDNPLEEYKKSLEFIKASLKEAGY